jgi:hypothetical protein
MGLSPPTSSLPTQAPALTSTLHQTSLLPRLLNTTTSFLYLRAYILTHILSFLPPLYYLTTVLSRLISNTTRVPTLQLFILSQVLLIQAYWVASLLAVQSYYASLLVLRQGWWLGKGGVRYAWKGSEGLRKKLWFELVVFVLGNGNGIVLILFWPGWIVIAGICWIVRYLFSS